MIKVFELLKNSKIKGYKMKTIRNSVSLERLYLAVALALSLALILCVLLALKTLL